MTSERPAFYQIIGVQRDGTIVKSGRRAYAPTDYVVASWGKARKCTIAMRYFPSKKGWRIYDLRKAHAERTGAGRMHWFGVVRSKLVYTTLDVAVMHALAIAGEQPELALT